MKHGTVHLPTAWGILLSMLMTMSSLVRAETEAPSAAHRAAAESLFNRALELLEAKNPSEACPKLEESQRLDPGVGTLLYLADCYQQLGRTASAWGTFREAAYLAQSQGQAEREQLAIEHAGALESQLSYLTLEVQATSGARLQVKFDGEVVGSARWGAPFPVDPGSHRLTATAPGHQPWSQTLEIASGAGQRRVVVPPLDVLVTQPVNQPAPQPRPRSERRGVRLDAGSGSGSPTWGWVLVSVGGAGVITSGVLALLALGDDSDADANCRPDVTTSCNAAGVDLAQNARTKATLSGVAAGVGLAALGAGITLLVVSPTDDSDQALGLRARGALGAGWLGVEGQF